MQFLGECLDKDLLSRILGSTKLSLYLYGDVVVVARSREDVERFLYVSATPRGIDLEYVKRLLCGEFAVSLSKRGGCVELVVSDIPSAELASILGATLARKLRGFMPFEVVRVDVVTTYRESEDGGLCVRNAVMVVLSPRANVEKIRRVVEDCIEEVKEVFCREHTRSDEIAER